LSIIENERFGLVFAKTGSINSGTAVLMCLHGWKECNPNCNARATDVNSSSCAFVLEFTDLRIYELT
jgi:hypothetical protein